MIHKLPNFMFIEINKRLGDLYGFMEPEKPYFRLVWSDDVLEKRWMTHTDEGFQLLFPEVREVPKYRNWKPSRYVLEGLQVVNHNVETDIPFDISYEPIWTFQDRHGEYLIPIWPAIKMILDTLKENVENKGQIKYRDPDSSPKEALENQEKRAKELEEALFGNETPITTALSHRSGVAYGPGSSPNKTRES